MDTNKFKFENSKQLAKELGTKHHALMGFYWHLENQVVKRRNLIMCTIVIVEGGENYLLDMSDAFVLAAFVYFDKINSIALNDF